MSIVEKTKALRDEAWEAVLATNAYKAYKGLDDAVKAMTSQGSSGALTTGLLATNALARQQKFRRITQADIAARVLKRHGEPLPVGRWLEKSLDDGIGIKGSDPLSNFRSTVSRDPRFRSLHRNNMYFWWFTDAELPDNWKEAADPDLLDRSPASSSIQEGGESHAATTT